MIGIAIGEFDTVGRRIRFAQFFLKGIHRQIHEVVGDIPTLLTHINETECIAAESFQCVLWCRVILSNLISTVGVGLGAVEIFFGSTGFSVS